MRRTATSGMSLIEVMVALSILSVISLGLIAMVSSSQQLTTITREKAIALNAVRSYIEAHRSQSLTAFLADTTTPANYIPMTARPGLPEPVPVLRGAVGDVFKVNYEDGSLGTFVQGGPTGVNTAYPGSSWTSAFSPASGTPLLAALDERAALKFPRDLDADGNATAAPAPATGQQLYIVPTRVRLGWFSGTGNQGAGLPQSVVVYVYFSPP